MSDSKNNKNLITADCAKEMGRKGGIKSGETRRRKRDLREVADIILSMGLRGGEAEEFQNLAESAGKNITVWEALVLAQVKKGLKGDTRSFAELRDTAGYKPIERQEISAEVHEENDELAGILEILSDYKQDKTNTKKRGKKTKQDD